jgi:hypothetical protein
MEVFIYLFILTPTSPAYNYARSSHINGSIWCVAVAHFYVISVKPAPGVS